MLIDEPRPHLWGTSFSSRMREAYDLDPLVPGSGSGAHVIVRPEDDSLLFIVERFNLRPHLPFRHPLGVVLILGENDSPELTGTWTAYAGNRDGRATGPLNLTTGSEIMDPDLVRQHIISDT